MKKVVCLALCLFASISFSKDLVEAKLPRTEFGSEVFIRGLLDKAPASNGRILLLFRGYPGIARIGDTGRGGRGPFLQDYFEDMIPTLLAAGISTVTVDCPTDQWRQGCSDAYRSSKQHADDVAALLTALRNAGDFSQIFMLGHSYGAVSTHWLSLNMGNALAGVIHSSTQSKANKFFNADLAASMARFSSSEVAIPYIYLHHKDDLCDLTPYEYAFNNAKDGAITTVTGGDRSGAACGAGSFHGFAGARPMVAAALAKWINHREVTPTVAGKPD